MLSFIGKMINLMRLNMIKIIYFKEMENLELLNLDITLSENINKLDQINSIYIMHKIS
jgi:hypothetical protein